ncbi:Protein-arginine kinase activator protein McsA [Sporobacter termitidis DSM 10068]|uniref:Protein-arginine kinase activator protein McsA n=1 Tax=Sporobacter termitidis DSM 10068 TaxID=1123282 RepID=A0A1M5YVP2_9FIRM|nr:UvrB/UvrC motif-containing protein [Sporobacter termitidis]SHI15898.1 Protein-arginine kinase activator protein McsA [Sporobacter termitidis DSM 10068]
MKCDNCGKEEVNFHYTSNINGNITEKHLCAECAGKLGYTGRSPLQPDASFEDTFAELFGVRPSGRMFGGYGMVFPTFIIPTVGMLVPKTGGDAAPDAPEAGAGIKVDIDDEMKKRREVNILREQMHQAAKAEDFEKAASLRDSIKQLESGMNS